jgi:hypothetical protein
MPFKHSCFISYRTGQAIVERFVRDLRESLSAELAPLLDLEVFADSRLRVGDVWEQGLAEALCESVSMVVVFTPTYLSEAHPYCAREFLGMKRLEEQRLKALGPSHEEAGGLIIPVVLRGADLLPEELRHRHYYNFDRYMFGDARIYRSPGFRRSVAEMASSTYRWHEKLRTIGKDLCADCGNFRLPSEQEVLPWLNSISTPRPVLPFRDEGR